MIKEKLKDLGISFSDNYVKGPSYLFPDGSYLNLIDQDREKCYGCHSFLDKFIKDNIHIDKDIKDMMRKYPQNRNISRYMVSDRILMYTDNAIVLNDGCNFKSDGCFISLPPERLTTKQLDALTLYIDDLHYKGIKKDFYMDLGEEFRSFNLSEDSTDDIIKEINRLYNGEKVIPKKETKFIMAFSGLGKTYFCQHNLGYIDLDEEILGLCDYRNAHRIIETYNRYGYKVLTNASSTMLRAIRNNYHSLTIYLPENTEEAKKAILDGIERRTSEKNKDLYYRIISKHYDRNYQGVLDYITRWDEVIYIPAGKHLSDMLKDK